MMSSAPAIANVDDASSLRKHERHQCALAGGQRLQIVSAQILRHQVIEPVFAFFRREILDQRQSLRVAAYTAVTCRRSVRWQIGLRRRLKRIETPGPGQIGELLAETLEIAERVFVDEAYQPEQFQQ